MRNGDPAGKLLTYLLRTDYSLLTPHYSLLTILPDACRCATHHYKKERANLCEHTL